jgi:hypothetical protein
MAENKCPECSKSFLTKRGLKDHMHAKHTDDDDESFASRAVAAELYEAMGIHNDDYDWLVEPYK